VDTPGGTAIIQPVFQLRPRVFKHVLSYDSQFPYAAFQALNIFVFDLVDGVKNHLR
jgi:hypothetical protein